MDLQPIKKLGVYSIFGKHYGDYLTNFITGCCSDIGTLCTSIKNCIGISPEGNPNLVLNQQGDWIPLSYILNYSFGQSDITFTNKGGDDWDISFLVNPTATQLSDGKIVKDYNVNIYHYVGGGGTPIYLTSGETTNKTFNATGNGAGVYHVEQQYNIYKNNVQVGIISTQSLFKVNGSGTLLAYFKGKGITLISSNSNFVNVAAVVNQSENYPIEWYSYDNSFTPTLIGTGLVTNLLLPTNSTYLIAQPVLDSVFTTDFPIASTTISTVTIN